MDVFIEILSVQYRNPGKYEKLKILWWNRGQCGEPWLISPYNQKIKIHKKDYSDWTRL